jgi:hypothetical protein
MPDTGVRVRAPSKLLDAARNRRLSLFVGAGFSKNISKNIPDASRLIEFAAKHAEIDRRFLEVYSSGDYMLVAEYLEIEKKLGRALRDLETAIHSNEFSVENSRPHIQLTELDVSSIYTTNWDHWIERAFEFSGAEFDAIRSSSDLLCASNFLNQPTQFQRSRVPKIIKFHGDFEYSDEIVFTLQSYFSRIVERTPLEALLEVDMFANSFLFVGYSFSDPNLRLIWHKMLKQRAEIAQKNDVDFPTSFLVSDSENPLTAKWLSKLSIEVIPVDPGPSKMSASIEALLDELIGAQR